MYDKIWHTYGDFMVIVEPWRCLCVDGHSFNLRNQQEFTVRLIKTVHYGLNSLAYLGSRIWELQPNNLKRLESVEAFKTGYLKAAHTEFVNHICTKWALYRFISIGFN